MLLRCSLVKVKLFRHFIISQESSDNPTATATQPWLVDSTESLDFLST